MICLLILFSTHSVPFIALRGNVRQLQSDQGTNFVGARREFREAVKEMDQESLKQLAASLS